MWLCISTRSFRISGVNLAVEIWSVRECGHSAWAYCLQVTPHINETQRANTRKAASSFLSARQKPSAVPAMLHFHFVLLMWGTLFVVCSGLQSTDFTKAFFVPRCTGIVVPVQAWTGPESSRRLRLLDFMHIVTWGWWGRWPPLPPGNIPGTHFC
jgi:hypothetical protein